MALEVWPVGYFVVFDVAAQEAHSTSTGAHGRGLGSEGTSSLFHCSTSRATGVFRSFLLRRMVTARMQQRTVWIRQKNHTYLPQAVTGWSEIEWKQNFRVSRATFHFLCRELRPFLERHKVVRTPLSVEQRVALCLTRLGSNSELTIISNLFRVGISTTCVALHEVSRAIVEHLAANYINCPTGQGL